MCDLNLDLASYPPAYFTHPRILPPLLSRILNYTLYGVVFLHQCPPFHVDNNTSRGPKHPH